MNKYLMMSAAAALGGLSGTPAHADTYLFHFGSAGGGSYCDNGTLHTNGVVYAWQHFLCGFSLVTHGQGLLGKVKGMGKVADMSDSYSTTRVLSYALPKNVKTGRTWYLFVTSNGVTSTLANAGPILPGHRYQSHHDAKSSFSVVKGVLAKVKPQ